MNYGKRAIYKRQSMLKSNSLRLMSRIRVICLGFLCLAVASGITIGGAVGLKMYRSIIADAPSLDNISVVPSTFASNIYANDGKTIIKTLSASGSNREYVTYNNISPNAVNAFVALEDERFFSHKGIDLQGILRVAITDMITGNDAGASTITQQLIKNQVFGGGNEASFSDKLKRKIQEQYLAVSLENKTSKEKILEYYLNTINLGNGTYGIQKASRAYFGKDASKLNVSEAAVLAPIAYSPTLMNPITHPEANKKRRLATLDNMLKQRLITQSQYDDAVADTDNVYERIIMQDELNQDNSERQNSYFVDALITQILSDLEKAGYSSYEANSLLFTSGLDIITTQDAQIQAILDNEFTDPDNFPAIGQGSYYELDSGWALSIYIGGDEWIHYHIRDLVNYYSDFDDKDNIYNHPKKDGKGISALTLDRDDLDKKIDEFIDAKFKEQNGVSYMESERIYNLEPQAAMVVMDPATGNVLALYGGRGNKSGDRVLNRATEAFRQPGSTFKVLAAFLPALDTGKITLASVFDDSYYSYGTNQTIRNWYNTGFEGLSPVRRGIYHSMNIVAARCLESTGVGTSMMYLKQLGFTKLDDKNDRNISLALGGLSKGVSVMELTAAYSAIANQGIYNTPKLYTAIYTHDGKLLLEKKSESMPVMKDTTAYLLTDAMRDTLRIGTATKCRFDNLDIATAGKTGTTSGDNDLWFCGYTPYYCAAIWSGFDNNFTQANTQYHKLLWKNCMEQIHKIKNCAPSDFTRPVSIVTATICKKCGRLAVTGLCDHNEYGNLITTEQFAQGTAPTEKCNCCIEVTLCEESGCQASPYCKNTKTAVLLNKEESESTITNGGTYDTKYCLTGIRAKICELHENGYEKPDEPDSENEAPDFDNIEFPTPPPAIPPDDETDEY